jgi:sucrose-6-phosphatase
MSGNTLPFSTTIDRRKLLAIGVKGVLVDGSSDNLRLLKKRLNQGSDDILLTYCSGRSLPGVMDDIDKHRLVLPDYIISADGTEIHRMPGEQPIDEWKQFIQQGFEREPVITLLEQLFPELEFQSDEYQSPIKISYFLNNAPSQTLDDIRKALIEAGLPARPVYSSDKFLDIIPERAGMGSALKYLVDSLVLTPNQVFVCGSSGNDTSLYQYGFRGIVPANASHELKIAVELRAYFSEKEYTEGLLDGLDHYRFFEEARPHYPRNLPNQALERAIDTLRRNITPLGFSAVSVQDNVTIEEDSNYLSVWSRDGIKTGLWSLSLDDSDLNQCFRRTLELLAEHQTITGQIPAYVRILDRKPDYGGIGNIASIDSVIWFVIGGCRYAAYMNDRPFLEKIFPNLKLAMQWLHAHDSNNCGLLEIPESSDWMDLFPRSYNVLYDEVLWYLACRDFHVACQVVGEENRIYGAMAESIRTKIVRQFWPTAKKLSEVRESFSETQFTLGNAHYLLSQLSPFGFSWRCDVYANLLACLVDLVNDSQKEQIFQFLWGVGVNSPYPIKCFYPPIYSGASDWKDYFVTNFLNLPHHYHNGGIWPFIGGLWVRFLAQIGRTELAHKELEALAEACRLGVYGEWEFNEWLHGQTGRPMGKAHQAWSAAGYVAAWKALNQDTVPADFEPLSIDMFETAPDSEKSD